MKARHAMLAVTILFGGIASSAEATETLTLSMLFDQTGPGGPYAKRAENGFNLALKQARAAGKLKPEILTIKGDPAGNPQRAATLASEAVSSDSSFMVYGTSSGPALAIAPIAQQAKLPLLYSGSATARLLSAGDSVYASGPYYGSYHELYAQFLGARGVKKLSVVFPGDAPALSDLARSYVEFGKKYGFQVDLNEVSISTTDFTTVTRKMLTSNPDAVAFMLYGPQSATFVALLRQANYQGYVGSNFVTDFLAAAGDQADGLYNPAPYALPISCMGGVKFGEAYQAEYGVPPDELAANGYNAGRMIARAIELADGDYSRANLKASMDKVLGEGLSETATCTLTFVDREPKVPGLLVQIEDGKQVEVKTR